MRHFILSLLICVFSLSSLTARSNSRNTWRKYGDTFEFVIPISALATALIKEDKEGCWQYIKSFAASMIITTALKAIVRSKRPTGNGKHSFPSQHTSASFSGAAFFGTRYGWEYGLPTYVAASAVGYSRLRARAHHVLDVLGGAAISIGINYIFVKPYEPPKSKPELKN